MDNLDTLRNSIDEIDSAIIKLFEKRMNIVSKIAKYKLENNLPVFNSAREEDVIFKSLSKVNNTQFHSYIEQLVKLVMSLSKDYQIKILESADKK